MDQSKKIPILYVDDEQNNLISFKSAFRRDFNIYTAASAAEGIKILHEQEINVIIADQRMPTTSGVEFFDIVRTAFPDPVRILITGYTDIEAVIDAINKGEIFRYIKKPWNDTEVKTAVYNAFEIFQTRKKLKTKIDELEKVNNELNRFVYSISHDLRSPLTSLMGVLNLAKMENSIQDPNGYIELIEKCVKKMDKFSLKVIEYYKSIRVKSEITSIDFKEMLFESIELLRLQNQNIQFIVDIDQTRLFYSDAFRVMVIIDNLISNAIKYQNPQQENPYVKIQIKITDDNAKIRIEDNGLGILEDHLNKIFQIFFRGEYSLTNLGIGLYIVKEALTKLGGDINVESQKMFGTVFNVTIPNKFKISEG